MQIKKKKSFILCKKEEKLPRAGVAATQSSRTQVLSIFSTHAHGIMHSGVKFSCDAK